ncbi:MAG: RNA polymerase sigma factor [Deltaproteobacteria bacterium]
MSRSECREPAAGRQGPTRFVTTQWSVVAAAGRCSSPQSREALAALCESYWYPLYALVRSQGYTADDAQDVTQEFFARLLARNDFAAADPTKGRFRSYLAGALKHFLANIRDQARARKRGGGRPPLPLDFAAAESRFSREPAHTLTAERAFARRWALTLLEQVLLQLRAEFVAAGRENLFDRLKVVLSGEKGPASYAALAADLETTEGAVKVAVHRVRRRYRELLREQIARTVADPEVIDDEIRDLFAALEP